MRYRSVCGVAVTMAVVLVLPVAARGDILVYQLDTEFSGGTAPEGLAPWLTVTIDDGGTAGSVTLTLAATNLTGTEFISGWYLNLDPILNPANLTFSTPTKTGSFDPPTIGTGADDFKADGDGNFDILFTFATTGKDGGSHRFGVGDAVEYTVTGPSTLTAASFDFLSASGEDETGYPTGVHVQSIGPDAKSGWVTVPEPAMLALVSLGAAGVALGRRRRG